MVSIKVLVSNLINSDKAELARYVVAGISATATDLATYWLLLNLFGPHFTSAGKGLSFVMASCVAYVLNKFWTFKAKKHSWSELGKFCRVYGFSFIANVAVNKIVIVFLPMALPPLFQQFVYPTAWLSATATSAILNYIGQKHWVFRK